MDQVLLAVLLFKKCMSCLSAVFGLKSGSFIFFICPSCSLRSLIYPVNVCKELIGNAYNTVHKNVLKDQRILLSLVCYEGTNFGFLSKYSVSARLLCMMMLYFGRVSNDQIIKK